MFLEKHHISLSPPQKPLSPAPGRAVTGVNHQGEGGFVTITFRHLLQVHERVVEPWAMGLPESGAAVGFPVAHAQAVACAVRGTRVRRFAIAKGALRRFFPRCSAGASYPRAPPRPSVDCTAARASTSPVRSALALVSCHGNTATAALASDTVHTATMDRSECMQ